VPISDVGPRLQKTFKQKTSGNIQMCLQYVISQVRYPSHCQANSVKAILVKKGKATLRGKQNKTKQNQIILKYKQVLSHTEIVCTCGCAEGA